MLASETNLIIEEFLQIVRVSQPIHVACVASDL